MPPPVAPGEFVDLGTHDVPGLVGARRVRAYLAGTVRPGAVRPLLVMLDGQNVFGDEGAYSGGWFAHETVDRIAARSRVSPIVVALDHGGERRIAEMTPFRSSPEGNLDEWLSWVGADLVPTAQRELGATAGSEHTAIAGSSMGGLVALYAHFRFPRTFGRAVAMSPAVWIVERPLTAFLLRRPLPPGGRLYLDAGGREGERMAKGAERVAGLLHERGCTRRELWFRLDPRAGHNERAWRRRLPAALRFVFRRT